MMVVLLVRSLVIFNGYQVGISTQRRAALCKTSTGRHQRERDVFGSESDYEDHEVTLRNEYGTSDAEVLLRIGDPPRSVEVNCFQGLSGIPTP